MKKCYSLFATLFAATALYAGDILEICPCDEFGYPVSEYTYTHDSPAPSGKKLYFNVRLVSRTQNNRVAAANRSHFDLVYKPEAGGGMSEDVDAVLNPLKIGIVVSGETKWAKLINMQPTPWRGGSSEPNAYNLTDLIFEYDTEPGDFALPIRLARDDKGTPWTEATSSAEGPVFRNQNKWKITYTAAASEGGAVSDANPTFCNLASISGDIYTWCAGLLDSEIDAVKKFYDVTLYNAGFWAQTLDIVGRTDPDSWEGYPDLWKSVAKGHKVSSTVRTNGEAPVTNNTVVWIWAVDKGWFDTVKARSTAAWVDPSVEMSGSNAEEIDITYDYDRSTSTPKKQKVWASRVEIPGGASKGDFTFKGVAEGDAYLIMSGSSNFLWKVGTGYEFVSDSFVLVPVKGVPAEREVTLRRTEAAETYIVTSDYETPLTTLELTLAEDYTDPVPVTVTITPKLSKPGDPPYAWTDYIRIAEDADGYERETGLTVTFKDGKAGAKTVYVFGRGAAGVDSGLWYDTKKGNRIEFEVTVDPVAAAGGKIVADNIYVKPADPVVLNTAELAEKAVRGGVALPININVSDNFTDMNDETTGYVVKFRAPGATEEEVEELKTKGGATALWRPKGTDGTLYAYDAATGKYTEDRPAIPNDVSTGDAELWLVAPNTTKSAVVPMHLTVTPPSQVSARAYATEDGDVPTSQFKEFDATTGDAAVAYFEIEISEKYDKAAAIYAFLKLSDESKARYVSGDCVVGSDFSAGIPIYRGATTSDGRGTVTLKDGIKGGTTLRFSIVLCTTSEYSEATKIEGFTSNDISLKVTNVAPVVNDIRMNGWRLNADKTAFKGSATVGIVQTFKFDVWDAELDTAGTGTEAMKIAYTFTDGSTTDAEKECTGDPTTWVIQRKFKTVGTDTCSIEYTITDKDGGKVSGSAYIPVSGNPYVSITGDETAFYENSYPQFTLALSETPDEDLTVRLTIAPQASGDKRGKLEISGGTFVSEGVYDFTFKSGVTPRQTFVVSDSDGTAGGASKFDFTAAVTTTSVKPGTVDTRWCDFYTPGALGPITVNNVSPTLIVDGRRFEGEGEHVDAEYNSSNAPIRAAIGKSASDTFQWSVEDVVLDIEKGIKVSIVDQMGAHSYTVTTTDNQEFTPEFKSAGPTTVTLTATDKDGGSITVTRHYTVNSTRQLNITAVGPSENGKGSPHANHYRGAGRGQGHVWVNATCSSASAFSFDYNCGLANFVNATARGYRKGERDDGSLTGHGSIGDIAITPDGSKTAGEPYFTYSSEYESFFYCWVKDVYDNGTMTSAIYGDVSPEVENAGSTQIALPTEKDDEDAYALTTFEVIFSKEYLPSDNIGDINNDGIPDIYALGYKGFGVSGTEGTDMNDLRTFNDDGDYCPFIFGDVQSSFIFMSSNTWASNTRKFTAFDEIRGIDPHLNDAYQVLAARGYAGSIPAYKADRRYTDPAADPTSTLSALEYDAYVQAGSPGEDNWSPERPTDPTTADTDGDGMPDGYEYYIWYKAHVGWMDGDGVHQYLTGHKYNHLDPTKPTFITPAEIAAAFDPLTHGGDWDVRDTDNDGLTDYQEFLLGTCPWEWDTDNDLLPDGYEVVVTGTDPRVYDTNDPILKRHADGTGENPDGDAMAVFNLPVGMIGVLDGDAITYFALDQGTFRPEVFVDPESGEATHVRTGTIFHDGAGRIYVTTGAIETYAKGEKTYLKNYLRNNLWRIVNEGGRQVLDVPATLDRGTEVTDITPDAEYFYKEISSEDQILFQPTSAQKIYTGWRYRVGGNVGSMDDDVIARGAATTAAMLMDKPVVFLNNETTIRVMHDDVLQMRTEQMAFRDEKTGYPGPARCGYNPTTAWQGGGTDSGEYVNHDEFMSMFYLYHRGVWSAADLTPSVANPFTRIWSRCATSPVSADTEGDQIPDGWELYVGEGKAAITHEDGSNASADKDGDWLTLYQEYSGIDSSAYYGWDPWDPAWRNKKWPTCPKHADTDEDGLTDAQEGGHVPSSDTARYYLSDIVGTYFKYNGDDNRPMVRQRVCWAGGMLDPCSCDTDMDGLPDEWEAEFHGSSSASSVGTIHTNVGGTNTVESITGHTVTWNMDGMDGTVGDARLDYDGDGLANWQEYLVGAMRCWRYDDAVSPWESAYATVTNMPAAGSGEWNKFWYETLLDRSNASGRYNPHFVNGICDPGRYMTRCPYAWDERGYGKWYYFKDGANHELSGAKNPNVQRSIEEWGTELPPYGVRLYSAPKKYISCDPRQIDSDHDGMDDYYELFHGMNPLLGAANVADGTGMSETPADYNTPCDLVFDAYTRSAGRPTNVQGGGATSAACARNNFWTNTKYREAHIKNPDLGGYDFIAQPWMNGMAAADADGDGIVNIEEAIMPNVQAASTYHHTDPTPLWMTDSTYTNSLVRRFYRLGLLSNQNEDGLEYTEIWSKLTDTKTFEWDGTTYDLTDFDGFSYNGGTLSYRYELNRWSTTDGWAFSFEENEGYDSDHDYLSDMEELLGKTKVCSDPQVHDDPLRRQAMYFSGEENPSFLQTPMRVAEEMPVELWAPDQARQNFLYFTVECWAKPDASIVDKQATYTLVERAIYADNAGPSDEELIRKNFMIGIKNGRWYACYHSTGTTKQTFEFTTGPKAEAEWTLVTATFDGNDFKLYVNGVCNNTLATKTQPEHGIQALAFTPYGTVTTNLYGTVEQAYIAPKKDYVTILVGASVKTKNGFIFDNAWANRHFTLATPDNPYGINWGKATTFGDYENYYKGYIDEVRIWDGARTQTEILDAYENRTRYTLDLAVENQLAVYTKWKNGCSRTPLSPEIMPALLMYHWAFDHVPGAVDAGDVIPVPAGFNASKSVTDAGARWVRPDDYKSPAWESVGVRSTVYDDAAWVPWINNTVMHMPRLDCTTLDSVYWSDDFFGYTPVTNSMLTGYNITSLSFPRNAETPSVWHQLKYASTYYDSHRDPVFDYWNGFTSKLNFMEGATQNTRYHAIAGYGEPLTNPVTDLSTRFIFTSRDRNTIGDDLLPMGGVYPRRISIEEGGLWDNTRGEDPKASDAWAQTGNDANNNGLPDWWEEYARANYCKDLSPRDPLEWDTTVTYRNGVKMPAHEAYARDLASGMVKDGSVITRDTNYVDTRDTDNDGMPDWWEEMFGLDPKTDNAADDPDLDGLSNYQEYILGERYLLPNAEGGFKEQLEAGGVDVKAIYLSPVLAYSSIGQQIPDYYLRYSDTFFDVTHSPSHFYGNEYFGGIATDHDFMEDWWENLYGTSYTDSKKYDPLADKDGDGWSTYAECRSSLWGAYFAADFIDKWAIDDPTQYLSCYPQPIIGVKATYYGKQDISGQPLVVRTTSGQTARTDATFVVPAEVQAQTRYIGAFAADKVMHGHLSPGMIDPTTIKFERALTGSEKQYHWNYSWYEENDDGWIIHGDGSEDEYGWWSYRTYGTFAEYQAQKKLWPMIQIEDSDLAWETFVEVYDAADGTTASLYIGPTLFGAVNCTTGEYELDMSKFSGDKSFDQYTFRVTYSSRIGHSWPQTVYLSDTRELTGGTGNGYVREGKNTIEAFIDLDGSGTYTEGEPYGVVQNVDVGWHKVPLVTIELTDSSHAVARTELAGGQQGQQGATTASTKSIAIRRTMINGRELVLQRTVMSKVMNLDSRSYLTEADVLSAVKFDLDCKHLVEDAESELGLTCDEIKNATYAIEGDSNTVIRTFVNEFKSQRTKPAPVSPMANAPVYTAAPTFAFSSSDETLTAYRLEVRRKGAETIYDSGITLLPGRVPNTVGASVYEITPPIYAGARVCAGAKTGAIFDDSTEYEWRVALFNAKYNTIEEDGEGWSDWTLFQMDVKNQNRYPGMSTGYGRVSLSVRYFGPKDKEVKADQVWVEAFENADFHGQPVARLNVGSVANLANKIDIASTDATLRGLPAGANYFRAFIDFNENGKRDDWESWGYVNFVGTGMKAIYSPRTVNVAVAPDMGITPLLSDYTIFVEDCDTNQNEIPDCMEADIGVSVDFDGDGISDSEEATYGTDKAQWDSDDDGMPDGWEVWAGSDPTFEDAGEAKAGDMMAFATIGARLVTIDSKRYMLATNAPLPKVGETVQNLEVYETYPYPVCVGDEIVEYRGVGKKVTLATAKVTAVEPDGTAVIVHSQVYDWFGYDPTTATAADGAKNTKKFTALDKYLVLRYLEALGLANEDEVNKKEQWSQYTLKPYVTDYDGDGIADGWELYVMFGPDGAGSVALADAKVSPWNPNDALKPSPDSESGAAKIRLIDEYDRGNAPTDPWNPDTDGDGIADSYAAVYHLKGDQAGEDNDGDGLSNYAEYLISEVFQFAKLDPDNAKTDGSCVDYFRKYGDLYFGEMFTDHDQMSDSWEQPYAAYVNRYVYDPDGDADSDGWSNFAEFKAGTHPGTAQTAGVDGETQIEYPIPAIAAKVVYRGTQKLAAPIVFQAWSEKTDPGMTGTPDAAWRAADDANATNVTKYVGLNPGTVRSYHLGTGEVAPGTVRIDFRDMAFEKTILTSNGVEVAGAAYPGEVGDARWFYFVQDRNGELYTSVTNLTSATPVKVGTIDYATGLLTVDFGNAALQGTVYDFSVNGDTTTESESKTSGIYSNCDKLNLGRSYVKIGWLPVKTDMSGNATYYLSDCTADVVNKGHVLEGKNKFVVFSDTDGDGAYTPGEPFGFVGGVDVGWQGGAFEVELTETSPIFARVDLRTASGEVATDRQAFQPDNTSVMDVSEKGTLLDDLKVKIYGDEDGYDDTAVADGDTATGAKTLRVRVVRVLVDGKNVLGKDAKGNNVYVDRAVVMDKRLDLNVRGYIHEGDFLSEDSFDIDWAKLQDQVYARDDDVGYYIDATNITYMIVMGEGDVVSGPSNTVFHCFVDRRYDSVAARQGGYVKPVIDPKSPGYAYGAKPAFRWAMQDKNGVGCNSYTSFKLQIRSGSTVVYDSGYRIAPARGADGWYEWTLADPLGSVVKTSGNYTWRVAMFNSKFKDDTFWDEKYKAWSVYNGGSSPTVETWSESGDLVVNVNQTQTMNDHGYSSIAAAVKYAGPKAVLGKGKVRLQAFTTADFAGDPVGEAFVTDTDELVNTAHVVANARVCGLPATGTYYLRAFIDSNGNGVKDVWESWGAAKESVSLTTASVSCPTVGIYIEDADTDGDWIPDAYEYVKKGNLESLGPEIIDGDNIRFIGTIYTSVGTAATSDGLPGASLTIFQNQAFVKMVMADLDTTVSLGSIRSAVEKKINPNTVKITALTLAPDGSKVTLSLKAEVTDSIAGELLGKIYDLSGITTSTATVTVKVYKKTTLADAGWTLVSTQKKTFGRDEPQVDVPVKGVDMTSGFYKVEVVQ